MRRTYLLIWVFVDLLMGITSRMHAQAQTEEIAVKGSVTNAVTGKGIKAMIIYKSMPTGGISGRFNDSTFKFSIFGTARYQITAEAKGFIPRTVIVDPKDIDASKTLQRDIQLTAEGQTITLSNLKFDQNKAIINPKSFQELDEVVAMMKDNPKMVIQLEGHTDGSGDAKINMKLSEDRVDVVKKYFVSKGIPKASVKTKAFGGTKPISKNSNLNRRVEMRVLKD
jgi:OmpA-OmpF porin, OOP family